MTNNNNNISEWKQGNSSVAKATTIHATTLTVGITTITKHDRISTLKKTAEKADPKKKQESNEKQVSHTKRIAE